MKQPLTIDELLDARTKLTIVMYLLDAVVAVCAYFAVFAFATIPRIPFSSTLWLQVTFIFILLGIGASLEIVWMWLLKRKVSAQLSEKAKQ